MEARVDRGLIAAAPAVLADELLRDLAPSREVPQAHPAFPLGNADQALAVRAEAERAETAAVARKIEASVRVGHIEDADAPLAPGRCEPASVG
jgi:hypothetical protein